MKRPLKVMAFTFESQAKQYPPHGTAGISYYPGHLNDPGNHIVDCLLYRNEDGELLGILNHFGFTYPPLERKGNVTIMVREDSQRKGIGTALLKAAMERWPINLTQQDYTAAGIEFIEHFLQPTMCQCNSPAATHRDGYCPTCGRTRKGVL